MSKARDVIAKALRETTRVQASLHCSEQILSALREAGLVVAHSGVIHKALQDAFQMGGIEAVQTLEDPNKFIKRKHRYADAALASLAASQENKG